MRLKILSLPSVGSMYTVTSVDHTTMAPLVGDNTAQHSFRQEKTMSFIPFFFFFKIVFAGIDLVVH